MTALAQGGKTSKDTKDPWPYILVSFQPVESVSEWAKSIRDLHKSFDDEDLQLFPEDWDRSLSRLRGLTHRRLGNYSGSNKPSPDVINAVKLQSLWVDLKDPENPAGFISFTVDSSNFKSVLEKLGPEDCLKMTIKV